MFTEGAWFTLLCTVSKMLKHHLNLKSKRHPKITIFQQILDKVSFLMLQAKKCPGTKTNARPPKYAHGKCTIRCYFYKEAVSWNISIIVSKISVAVLHLLHTTEWT